MYIYKIVLSKPHGNRKPKVYNRYTKKRKRNPKTTLKIVIKSREKRTEEEGKQKEHFYILHFNKMAIRTYISVITLNLNGLNTPTKRHRLAEWIQKQDLDINVCCLQETQFTSRDT